MTDSGSLFESSGGFPALLRAEPFGSSGLSAPAFEPHHLLYGRFGCLRHLLVLAELVGAFFADFPFFSVDADDHELVDFFTALLALGHAVILSQATAARDMEGEKASSTSIWRIRAVVDGHPIGKLRTRSRAR